VSYLNCKAGGIYIDATLGSGGHALRILKDNRSIGKLIGIDRDAEAIAQAQETLKEFQEKTIIIQDNFARIREILDGLKIDTVDGILLDLGLSSQQLENAERGFSFMLEGSLDMRMDRSSGMSAFDLVNRSPLPDLEKIIREYGDEGWARRIARSIVTSRKKDKIRTTTELAHIITRAIPRHSHPKKIHPATKTFQALRIAVNDELNNLERVLDHSVDRLKSGGRFCVISFHSLEDRIVKNVFRSWEKREGKIRILTPKPVTPGPEEVEQNPRARSAKLRAAEKL
jgi:16S rRNA (cytosine1402-N4)-methyltransferase